MFKFELLQCGLKRISLVQCDLKLFKIFSLLKFENTGLKDLFLKIHASYARPAGLGVNDTLGISVLIDGVEVYKSQGTDYRPPASRTPVELFVPKQSTLEVLSLNTSANNTQERACVALGWYL